MSEYYEVRPGSALSGTARIPGDKSISHRAAMLAAVADGATTISGFLPADDCLATLQAVTHLGASVEGSPESGLAIEGCAGELRPPAQELDLGNSGTGMRLLAGLLSGQRFQTTLTGDESLRQRPMERIVRPLSAMGARITSRNGHAPLTITGQRPLRPLTYEMPIASAQVKSAILLAGLFAEGVTSVSEPRPSRDHTERLLEGFGVPVERDGLKAALTGPAVPLGSEVSVPGDFSAAAFFIGAAAAVQGSDITLRRVGLNPTRTGFLEILREMGADIEVSGMSSSGGEPVGDIRVRGRDLSGVCVDPALVPSTIDEFPILFVVAAMAEGVTRVSGAEELRHKESDRIAAMANALGRVGADVEELQDGLIVRGRGRLEGGHVESRGDHRVAMAMAVAACRSRGPIHIEGVENVATSFPDFSEQGLSLGLDISTYRTEGAGHG